MCYLKHPLKIFFMNSYLKNLFMCLFMCLYYLITITRIRHQLGLYQNKLYIYTQEELIKLQTHLYHNMALLCANFKFILMSKVLLVCLSFQRPLPRALKFQRSFYVLIMWFRKVLTSFNIFLLKQEYLKVLIYQTQIYTLQKNQQR